MKPGRELDALVAEKVMGFRVKREDVAGLALYAIVRWPPVPGEWLARDLPPYSTDIAAAWEVVEKMSVKNGVEIWRHQAGCWVMEIEIGYNANDPIEGHGESAPHAICLAALKAKGVDV